MSDGITIETLTEDVSKLNDALEASNVERDSLVAKIGELETANGVLETEKAALQAKVDAADAAPKVRSAKAPKVRKIGALDGDALEPAALLELIRKADTVEVAFSDGTRELAAIPARQISGDAWGTTVAGLLLRGVDIELSGLGVQVEIAGYGLLLDGELVAYRPRMEPLRIAPGSRVSLAGDIIF